MKKNRILILFVFVMLFLVTNISAYDWSPQGNISLKDRYYILNNPADQCDLGEIPLGANADGSWNCTNSSSYLDVNSTTWWADVSSWLSGWFFKSGSSLAFNESKFNDSVRNIDNLSDKNIDNISYSKFINVPAACPDGYAVTNLSYPSTCVQFSTIDDNRSWNESYANGLYSGIEWDYNQSLATYNLWNDIWSSTYNVTYDKWSYNQTYSGSTFNETYAGLINNGSYLSTYNSTYDKWSYNQTYSGSTYNATYNKWSYNQSLWLINTYSDNWYNYTLATYNLWNEQWLSTYNITYDRWSYNQTYSGSTYNTTYERWSYNQSLWTNVSGTAIYYGDVGIGTSVPTHKLEVNGTALINQNLDVSGNITVTYVKIGAGGYMYDNGTAVIIGRD